MLSVPIGLRKGVMLLQHPLCVENTLSNNYDSKCYFIINENYGGAAMFFNEAVYGTH